MSTFGEAEVHVETGRNRIRHVEFAGAPPFAADPPKSPGMGREVMANNNPRRNRACLTVGRPVVIAVVLFACSAAHAQFDRCVELARNLQVTSERVADSETFESQRLQFCDEVRETRKTSGSRNVSGAFKALGLSRSSSSSSVNKAFSKYCRDEGREEGASSHYREYFRGIAPGAYDVLLACEMANRGDEGLRFEMLSPPTHNKLSLNVSYRTSQQGATATLRWNSNSAGADGHLDCHWGDDGPAKGLDPVPRSQEPRTTLTSGQVRLSSVPPNGLERTAGSPARLH